MTTATRKEFAGLLGCSPAWITKLGKEGRLVLTTDGKRVEVEASREKIERTGGGRPDVASRHAAARGEAKPASAIPEVGREEKKRSKRGKSNSEESGVETLTEAKARKERAQADQEEMKARQMAGDLIAREDVEAAMKFIGGSVRAAFEVFPDQVAPLVAPIIDLAEVHELITQACRDALYAIKDAFDRQLREIEKNGTS